MPALQVALIKRPMAREVWKDCSSVDSPELRASPFVTIFFEGTNPFMVTPERDLRSAGPLWLNQRVAAVRCRSRPSRRTFDVAIIGAGVSGALAATALIGLGKSVVILDRRGPAEGSTAASTAMIQWEIDQSLTKLADRLGERRAAASYRSSLNGVFSLRRSILSHGIACDWADRMALTVTGDAMGARAMAGELKLRQKHRLPSYWTSGHDLKAGYGIDRSAALLNAANGELHPS
jgi:FAD dependent oxidoreductase